MVAHDAIEKIMDMMLFSERITLGSENQVEDNPFEATNVNKEVEVTNVVKEEKALIIEQKEWNQYGYIYVFKLSIDFECVYVRNNQEEATKFEI